MSILKTAVVFLLLALVACSYQSEDPAAYATWRGENFLKYNATKEGVESLPSGLQYRVIREGTGARPGYRDKVTVHYRGTLIDGTEFDSSYSRGTPATFPLNRVIKGVDSGLKSHARRGQVGALYSIGPCLWHTRFRGRYRSK